MNLEPTPGRSCNGLQSEQCGSFIFAGLRLQDTHQKSAICDHHAIYDHHQWPPQLFTRNARVHTFKLTYVYCKRRNFVGEKFCIFPLKTFRMEFIFVFGYSYSYFSHVWYARQKEENLVFNFVLFFSFTIPKTFSDSTELSNGDIIDRYQCSPPLRGSRNGHEPLTQVPFTTGSKLMAVTKEI